jgi:hypothetical protein
VEAQQLLIHTLKTKLVVAHHTQVLLDRHKAINRDKHQQTLQLKAQE